MAEGTPFGQPSGSFVGKDGRAGYLHGLAVRRDRAGQGLGEELISWCMGEVGRRGRESLRLDCMGQNPGLCKYYRDLGFIDAGLIVQKHWQWQLFEKPLRAAKVD